MVKTATQYYSGYVDHDSLREGALICLREQGQGRVGRNFYSTNSNKNVPGYPEPSAA